MQAANKLVLWKGDDFGRRLGVEFPQPNFNYTLKYIFDRDYMHNNLKVNKFKCDPLTELIK